MGKKLTRAEKILYPALAVVTAGLLLWHFCAPAHGRRAVVRVAGKVVGIYDLNQDRTVTVGQQGCLNVLEIEDGKARVRQADCPDQVCVRTGAVSRAGESILCLPHKVAVEIISRDGASGEGDVDAVAK